jgi:phosphoglycolate phosphatase
MKDINTIIWDWNGTLLNDIGICIEAINTMLERRNHPTISRPEYLEIFTFPVKDYYVKAGFDFTIESFDDIAIEFMDLYFQKLKYALVFPGAFKVLNTLKQNNFYQIMISAMEHDSLVKSVKEKEFYQYFDFIAGINDHFAGGKIENARNTVRKLNIDPERTLLIGDTIHDYEVAGELRIQCVLISHGHQSASLLERLDCTIVNGIEEIPGFLGIDINTLQYQDLKII